ncbi:hypothetical protein B0H19DRAFT_1257688 [Mycena capillaripes]|nr:hypothetical protein B0H19DRAFT_1257688 [Mycena capillaripes]
MPFVFKAHCSLKTLPNLPRSPFDCPYRQQHARGSRAPALKELTWSALIDKPGITWQQYKVGVDGNFFLKTRA